MPPFLCSQQYRATAAAAEWEGKNKEGVVLNVCTYREVVAPGTDTVGFSRIKLAKFRMLCSGSSTRVRVHNYQS